MTWTILGADIDFEAVEFGIFFVSPNFGDSTDANVEGGDGRWRAGGGGGGCFGRGALGEGIGEAESAAGSGARRRDGGSRTVLLLGLDLLDCDTGLLRIGRRRGVALRLLQT